MSNRPLRPAYRKGNRIQPGWDLQLIDGTWLHVLQRDDYVTGIRLIIGEDSREFWVRPNSTYMTRYDPGGGQ